MPERENKSMKPIEQNKQDLRVIKTHEAIRRAFEEMMIEMEYSEITVKELAARARINRKTFYLHYEHMDDLLAELQDEIVSDFISQDVSYHSLADIKRITRYYFEYVTNMSPLHERMLCTGPSGHIGDMVNAKIMEYQAKKDKGAFSNDPYEDNLVFAYFAANSTILYRQWVADGKKMPVEDLIRAATKIICGGMSAYVKA